MISLHEMLLCPRAAGTPEDEVRGITRHPSRWPQATSGRVSGNGRRSQPCEAPLAEATTSGPSGPFSRAMIAAGP